MAGNSIGQIFRFTSFGESHGPVIGGVIDGCPPGIALDLDLILKDMARRQPGGRLTTKRKEADIPQFLSGLIDDTTTGAPIAFIIPNSDARPEDYEYLKEMYRPSHADYTYHKKYGIDDHRLVHRASARETAVRVVAGAIAKQVLAKSGIFIAGITSCIGHYNIDHDYSFAEMEQAAKSAMQCPDKELSKQMQSFLKTIRKEGDSIGCEVQGCITGVPAGLGEPVFNKLQSALAAAMLSINAAVAFDFGSGRYAAWMKGSEYNDLFTLHNGHIRTATNNSGGIQAGISNGEDILFRVIFKPIPTIGKVQKTVSRDGKAVKIKGKGRHDVCAAPRVVPVVEAMAALVISDQLLLSNSVRL
ncbi:MAG: chorismate synthase [Bacteroidota bacterium]